MSQKVPLSLPELRQYRGVIDQVITGMEILSGSWPLPPLHTSMVHVEELQTRRALPAAKRKYTRRKQARVAAAPKKPTAAAPTTAKGSSTSDDDVVLNAVKSLGSATCEQVVKATKLESGRVKRAKGHLERAGRLVVTGWARGARWSLPGAKEAP